MAVRDRKRSPAWIRLADYRTEQGLDDYDDLARGWRQLILKKKSSGPSIGKPSKRSLELFFMVCYDLDRFSQFVASDGFSDIYDLSAEAIKDIRCDDLELMQFGFRFLRQVLFGEETIPLRKEAAEQRLGKLKNNSKQDLAQCVDIINNGYGTGKCMSR